MGAGIRMVAAEIPNTGIVFFRKLIGISMLLPLLLYRGQSDLRTRVPHLHLLRGLAGSLLVIDAGVNAGRGGRIPK